MGPTVEDLRRLLAAEDESASSVLEDLVRSGADGWTVAFADVNGPGVTGGRFCCFPIVDYAAAGITPDEEVAPQVAWSPLPEASAERLGVSPAVLAESGMKEADRYTPCRSITRVSSKASSKGPDFSTL